MVTNGWAESEEAEQAINEPVPAPAATAPYLNRTPTTSSKSAGCWSTSTEKTW